MKKPKQTNCTTIVPAENNNILDRCNKIAKSAYKKTKTLHSKWFGCVLGLALAWWIPITHAEQSHEYHYRYISLSKVTLPSGFVQFTPVAIDDKRKEKIANSCSILKEQVISAPNVESIYEVPLNFEKVPTNALFWLHCKDCGETFERPFTYENHRQIWW